MPLLPNGNHYCLGCERERQIANARWILSDFDDTVFSSPMCPCGASETFFVHDLVFMKTVSAPVEIPPEQAGDAPAGLVVSWEEPDPEDFRARHMLTIHEKAQAIGRGLKVRKLKGEFGQPADLDYPTPPAKLAPREVREHVQKVRPAPPKIRTKEDAEVQIQAVTKQVAEQRAAARAKRKELEEGD